MPSFAYNAINAQGAELAGEIQATDLSAARDALRGGGLLAQWGVLDFAGGIVVHATAGFAALASVIYVGKRRDRESLPPHLKCWQSHRKAQWFSFWTF